jgi:hypothetical protein
MIGNRLMTRPCVIGTIGYDRLQRNHITCAVLVWIRLKAVARKVGSTVYQLKQNLLSEYLRQELRSPSVHMNFM